MLKVKSLKRKINQKTIMISFVTILIISSFIIINKYDLISRAIGYFAAINNGYTKEVKSIELKTTGYDTGQEGAIKVTKSAEWTGLNEATVKIKVESNPIDDQKDKDIIFLLDISGSYGEGEVLAKFQSNFVEAYQEIIDESPNNRVAFFTFATNAEKRFDFTRDKTKLETSLQGLKFGGSTNFYYALKAIEQYLATYTFQSNKELHLIFISDGFANEGRGADEKEYKILKERYPDLIIDGVREGSEMSVYKEQYDIKRISDRQYYAIDYKGYNTPNVTIKDMIIDAALSKSYYSSINISDYINPTYFNYKSASSYYGEISKTTENGVEKVVWDLDDGRFKSGYAAELEIKLNLKSAYQGIEAYFPTNNSLYLSATDNHISNINTSTTNTPVLQSWFEVNYDSNTPTGCSATFNKTEKYFPFQNVTIKGSNLTCQDWAFKGWEVNDAAITRINSDTFVMPLRNVTIGAEWRQLSINKSMDGTINERSTLYEVISDKAVLDNIKSDYVSSSIYFYNPSSTTNGQGVYTYRNTQDNKYPIRYYRGNIDNNNVIFGNKCWKIVRTTETGGIKMVYNGVPTSGRCTASGVNTTTESTQIWNKIDTKDHGSLASTVSYSYGTEYKTQTLNLGSENWPAIVGKTIYSAPTSYTVYASPSYYWNGSSYTISGYISTSTPGNYPGYAYCYYTTPQTSCSTIHYVLESGKTIKLDNGEIAANLKSQAQNTTWYYGNDVTYSNGVYTLTNTVSMRPYYYGDYIGTISEGRHYTCMSSSTTCSTVKYVFADIELYLLESYIELTGGTRIETAYDEMLINPRNTTKSLLMKATDNWYASNMTPYTYMLEDTQWCNDKENILENAGWYKEGNSTISLHFGTNNYNDVLKTCRTQDAYTVSTANGNGYLTYPVGLLTEAEYRLAGAAIESNTNFYLYNGVNNWTMSPIFFNNLLGYYNEFKSDGTLTYTSSANSGVAPPTAYIRPAVSLKPGVFASTGDGTPNNPYVIEME